MVLLMSDIRNNRFILLNGKIYDTYRQEYINQNMALQLLNRYHKDIIELKGKKDNK